jgi:hypothetical protein
VEIRNLVGMKVRREPSSANARRSLRDLHASVAKFFPIEAEALLRALSPRLV